MAPGHREPFHIHNFIQPLGAFISGKQGPIQNFTVNIYIYIYIYIL
jgi:hypothetical protein